MKLLDTVIKARKDSDVSVKELAEKIGVTQSMIYKIESGDSKGSIDVIQKICEVLGFSIIIIRTDQVEKLKKRLMS